MQRVTKTTLLLYIMTRQNKNPCSMVARFPEICNIAFFFFAASMIEFARKANLRFPYPLAATYLTMLPFVPHKILFAKDELH